MKKIAFFISSLNIGGIEKALLSMISKMDLKENKIYVYTIKKEGALLKEILKYAEVREIPMLKETVLYDLRKTLKEDLIQFKMNKVLKMVVGKIKKLITKKDENFNILKMKPLDEKFDIAVAYQVPISPITVYVAEKVNSTKKVLWVHSDIAGLENLKQKQYEQYIEKYNKVFTVADKCKKSFLESFPTMKEKTENFYNLIPKEDIVQKSKDKQKEEYAEDYFNIVTVARLTPGKGYEIALLILKELIKRECKVRWYGIGTGELKEYLETEIIRNNLAENFILLGEKENPYPYVKNANVYVQISEKEGYSISIAEAICLNKIVISTNIPVMQENIINNKTGFIVSENVEEITNILEKLIKDKEFYNKINKNIIEAKININFDKELKKLEEL